MTPAATAAPVKTACIDGHDVAIHAGETILDAAKRANVRIPTLCKHPDVHATAACGICVVKVGGGAKMLRACCTPIEPGMNIVTQDPEIVEVRKSVVELILSDAQSLEVRLVTIFNRPRYVKNGWFADHLIDQKLLTRFG